MQKKIYGIIKICKDFIIIVVADFLKDISKQGLQSFLMPASKELILTILPLISFGGTAKLAFELLGKVIGGK